GLFSRIGNGDLLDRLTSHQILAEGHPTYGGLAGRDLKATAEGLRTVVREDYLRHRIEQVRRFGQRLHEYGIPVMQPFGGHAVYVDVDRFFAGTKAGDEDLPGIALTALMLVAGHRLCELGIYAFGSHRDGEERPPDPRVNNVRAAVPRLAYEDQDLSACAGALRVLYEHRDRIPPVRVDSGRDLDLRHFKSRFSFA
ncbi:tyrosine phenol-lyase, partial [candidate division WOR-3 bacterium]|nr:tyrosine phenol-lyase [candidate division WOR-3 bacterium]